jgi:signal transduction histidine kinase
MRSPRNDRTRTGVKLLSPFRSLSVRLVVILASTAALALLVSGIALSQVLPGYFLDQAARRADAAVRSMPFLVRARAELYTERPAVLFTRELRNTRVLEPAAQAAANSIAQGTVDIYERLPDGSEIRVASASPGAEIETLLREQGLQPDAEVPEQTFALPLVISAGASVDLRYVVRDVYTNRLLTLERANGTLIGAGVAAFVVSLLVGVAAARYLTSPLARLRRVSGRLAAGELDVRSPAFEVVEINELATQFNVMADRLSESLRMLEADRDRLREFVADVSHELRTPIAALRTFTDLQRDGRVDDAQRTEFLDRSKEQIDRMEWMSTNLLDLSRMDSGIFPLDVRDGDLRDPVRAVVEAHAEQAEQRGVSLSFEVPTSPMMLPFDRERIVQLLNNLVANALKFTPSGGEVVVDAQDVGDAAVVEVRDSGPGISPDELPHIFDRFFRGTNVGEARASGSGLGLAITRSLAEMHGGRIDVISAPGRGSVFSVRLPRDGTEGQ